MKKNHRILREVRVSDVDTALDLRLEMLRDSPLSFLTTEKEFLKKSRADHVLRMEKNDSDPDVCFMGIFEKDRLIATAGLIRPNAEKRRHLGFIVGVFTKSTVRGEGLCSSLLDALIAYGRESGIEIIHLGVESGNKNAKSLYALKGFECFATEPKAMKFEGRYIDEDLMMLVL